MNTAINPAAQKALEEAFVERPIAAQLGIDAKDLGGAVKLAQTRLSEGRDLEAFQMFCGLVLLDPTHMDFQIGLAESALAAGAPEMALQSAALVITAHPDWPHGYFLSGRACLALDDPAAAAEDFADAITHAGTAHPDIAAQAKRLMALCQS